MNRLLDFVISAGIVILTLAIVVYALIAIKIWGADTQVWFLRTGDYRTVIIISLAVILIGIALKKLLYWEIHSTLGPKRGGRK